jgi:hypothetical protein
MTTLGPSLAHPTQAPSQYSRLKAGKTAKTPAKDLDTLAVTVVGVGLPIVTVLVCGVQVLIMVVLVGSFQNVAYLETTKSRTMWMWF